MGWGALRFGSWGLEGTAELAPDSTNIRASEKAAPNTKTVLLRWSNILILPSAPDPRSFLPGYRSKHYKALQDNRLGVE
jgi:hypothetical protein